MPCPTEISNPAQRLRVPCAIVAAVTAPGAITPDSEMMIAFSRKAGRPSMIILR
ncbi:MAG: hypothetical protein ACYTEN_01155 [Planctomycetota bacterium]